MLSRIPTNIVRGFALRLLPQFRSQGRFITGAAVSKLRNIVKSEHQMEKEQYEQIESIKKFMKDYPQWKLTETDGDVSLKMSKSMADKEVILEWQLVSPFGSDFDGANEEGANEGQEEEMPAESTDFTITIQDKAGERGLIYYCQTTAGEGHRYMIGNVRSFASAAERDAPTAYNGPDFEDLDETLQESFDEFLSEAGITDEVCNFVDASAMDKEQREYMRWLKNVESFIQA